MSKLKFDEAICEKCTTYDCLIKCQYMDFDLDKAKEERRKLIKGQNSFVLKDCVTCYACEEYCPYNNHPFYQIVEQQEKFDIHPVPRPLEKAQVAMMEPNQRIEQKKLTEPVINMCVFSMLKGAVRGKLFQDASVIMGRDIFCNLMYLHFARNSTIAERLPKMIDNITTYYLKPNNIKELVCYHDECYGTYTSWAPAFGIEVPFKPVHLFDYLYSKLLELKSDIKPLNLKVAYHRNCSTRLIPETEHFVNDIFSLIGVTRVKREYDYENALCCGAVFEAQQRFELAEKIQDKIVEDLKASGVSHCVYNCPMCFFTLAEKVSKAGIIPVMMSDLCQQALGE